MWFFHQILHPALGGSRVVTREEEANDIQTIYYYLGNIEPTQLS